MIRARPMAAIRMAATHAATARMPWRGVLGAPRRWLWWLLGAVRGVALGFPAGWRGSLRVRLVVGALALAATGLLITDLASVVLLRSYLLARTDSGLSGMQARLSRFEQERPAHGPAEVVVGPAAVAHAPASPAAGPAGLRLIISGEYVIELRDARDRVVARYSFDPDVLPPYVPPRDELRARGLLGHPFNAPADGTTDASARYRVLVTEPGGAGGGSVLVAADLGSIDAPTSRLAGIEAVASAVVLVLVGLLGTYLVRVGLRPLQDVEHTAEAILSSDDLSRRVPVRARRHTEIGRLGATINTMLDRVEAAFTHEQQSQSRLRRFVADASHELRTPLASVRGLAELGHHEDTERADRILSRIDSEAIRMSTLVEELLLLARLDQQRPRRLEPVDLVPVTADAVEAARAIAPTRPLRLIILPDPPQPGTPDPVVLGDPAQLRQVATNLLSNALHHTPPDTPITIRVGVPDHDDAADQAHDQHPTPHPHATHQSRRAVLTVIDHGPGIDPADAPHIFDRFYQADPARARSRDPATRAASGSGAGLGLSIVEAIVTAHDGQAIHAPTPGGGATFHISLPLHQDPIIHTNDVRSNEHDTINSEADTTTTHHTTNAGSRPAGD